MRYTEKKKIDKWLGGENPNSEAIVTVLTSGFYEGYGSIDGKEIEELVSKVKDIPVYIGHQVTPEDKVGSISESWLEEDGDVKSVKAKIAIDEESPSLESLKAYMKNGQSDFVSLTFKYNTIGSNELRQMADLSPLELSFVEDPECENCVVEIASFEKDGDKKMEVIATELSDKEVKSLTDFLEDGFLRLQHISNFRLSKKNKSEEKVRITGVALKPGVFHDVEYSWESMKLSAPSLVGQPISIDHSKSVRDVIGKVTDAWADDEEEMILFTGIIDDSLIAEKIEEGFLSAVSPEVRSIPKQLVFPLEVKDVVFSALSIVARPECRGCRLTTKSLEHLKSMKELYETGLERSLGDKEGETGEKYIKDNHANEIVMVLEEGGEITMSEEGKATAEPAKTAPQPKEVAPVIQPSDKPATAEPKPADKPKVDEPGKIIEVKEKVETLRLPEEKSQEKKEIDQVVDAINKKEKKEVNGELSKDQKKIAELTSDLEKLKEQFETKYEEIETSYKALLSDNIHQKETVLGFDVPHDRIEKLQKSSVEVLNELWVNVKDMTPRAQFGAGPKGMSTAIPHVAAPKGDEKPKKSRMQEIYDDMSG